MRPESLDPAGLYRQHGAEVLGFLARRCPLETAEDLLQETFLQVVRSANRIECVTLPRAWLFGIARNVLALHFRRQARAESAAELATGEEATTTAEDRRLPAMREAIAQLPPDLREALELRLGDELSYEEIAGVLGIPLGTVRSRLHHAVRRLRAALTSSATDL